MKAASQAFRFPDPLTGDESSLLTVFQDSDCGIVHTEGVVLKGFKGSLLQRKRQAAKLLEYRFLPFESEECFDLPTDQQLLHKYHACLIKRRNTHNLDLEDERFALLKRSLKSASASSNSSSDSGLFSSADSDSGSSSPTVSDAAVTESADSELLAKDLLISTAFPKSQQSFRKQPLSQSSTPPPSTLC